MKAEVRTAIVNTDAAKTIAQTSVDEENVKAHSAFLFTKTQCNT